VILKTAKGEKVNTAFASKQSRINLKIIQAHTSVLVPLLIIPVAPFLITVEVSCSTIVVMILCERKGWTISMMLKKLRQKLAGHYRTKHTRRKLKRLAKY